MRSSHASIIFALLAHANFSTARAATTLAPIIVTAKRPPPVLSKSTITASEILSNQYRHVADALLNVPGVYAAQHGGQGQLTSVFVRGGNSEHTSIIIDGMNVNDPSTGTFNFAGLGTEGVSTVTVLRGASVADGTPDALTGAIMIETRRGQNGTDDTSQFDTKIEGGTYDTYGLEYGLEGNTERTDYHVRIIRNASRGSVTSPKHLQSVSRQAQSDPSDRTGFIARTGVQLNDVWRLNMWNRVQEANDTSASTFYANPARHGRTLSNFHRFEAESDFDRYTQKMGYSLALTERTNQSEYAPFDPSNTTKGRTDGLYFKNEIRVTQKYSVLTHFANDRHELLDQTQFQAPVQHRAIAQTAGIGQKISPTNVWNIELWARWHHHTAFKHSYSTKAKTDYTIIATQTALLASYSTGIRAPSLYQLHEPRGGNASLKPEKSKGFDIGIEQEVIQKRVRVGATYFEQNFHDLITSVPTGPLTLVYKNTAKAKTYGVESFLEGKLGTKQEKPVTLRIEHTFLHAKDALKNAQLMRRPMHKLSAGLTWQVTDPLLLGLGITHYGKRADRDAITLDRVYRKGPIILRVWGSYTVNAKIELFARVENVGNCQYEYPEGFAAPCMAIYGGVKFKSSL